MRARRQTEQALTDVDFAIEAARVYGVYEGKSKEVKDRIDVVLRRYRDSRAYAYGSDLKENLRNISIDKYPPPPKDGTLEGVVMTLLEHSTVIRLSTDREHYVRQKCAAIIEALKEEGVDARYDEGIDVDSNYGALVRVEADYRVRSLR